MGIFEKRVVGSFWYSGYQGSLHQRGLCEHALEWSQSDHLAVCLRKIHPWYASQVKLCRQGDCTPSLTCLSWMVKKQENATRKITCLAPDWINLLIYKYVYYFPLKVPASQIYSLMLSGQRTWNMKNCSNAIRLKCLEAGHNIVSNCMTESLQYY